MNDRAKIVLWLGLFMILFQVVKDWPIIKAVLFTGSGINVGGGGIPLIPGNPGGIPGEVPPAESPGGSGAGEIPPAEAPPALGPKVIPGEILPPDVPAILPLTYSQHRTT